MRDTSAARLVRKMALILGWPVSPVIVWPKHVPSSCVIAYFHSNWDLPIAREIDRRKACLMRTHDDWSKPLGSQHIAWTNPLRDLNQKR